MLSNTDFLTFSQWAGILSIACGVLALVGFLFKWGIRFRLVGITGFMIVLTGGLFGLGLVPFTRSVIPGAVHFSLVYDNGGSQTVIAVSPSITESELEATLRQAASDFFSYGRMGGLNRQMKIRARTITHPQPGVSQPLFLGEVKRSISAQNDEQMAIEIYPKSLAQLPKSNA